MTDLSDVPADDEVDLKPLSLLVQLPVHDSAGDALDDEILHLPHTLQVELTLKPGMYRVPHFHTPPVNGMGGEDLFFLIREYKGERWKKKGIKSKKSDFKEYNSYLTKKKDFIFNIERILSGSFYTPGACCMG